MHYDDLPLNGRWPLKKKARTERVVRDNFFEGFMDEVSGALNSGLEYASTSGLYGYNPVRRMAYDAGREFGREVIAQREDGKIRCGIDYKIPAEVFAKAYAMMRLA